MATERFTCGSVNDSPPETALVVDVHELAPVEPRCKVCGHPPCPACQFWCDRFGCIDACGDEGCVFDQAEEQVKAYCAFWRERREHT